MVGRLGVGAGSVRVEIACSVLEIIFLFVNEKIAGRFFEELVR